MTTKPLLSNLSDTVRSPVLWSEKYCSKCKQTLSVEMFYKSTKKRDGLQGECKGCNARRYAQAYAVRIAGRPKRLMVDLAAPRRCSRCQRTLAAEMFRLDSSRGHPRRKSQCRSCRSAAEKARRKANPEASKAASKRWRSQNPERARASARARRQANPDKVRLKNKAQCDRWYKAARETVLGRARNMRKEVQARAREKGRSFDLDVDWFLSRLLLGHCEVSGRPFDLTTRPFGVFRNVPDQPSIDRIDSAQGYTKASCRMVLWHANVAFNEYGLLATVQMFRDIEMHAELDQMQATMTDSLLQSLPPSLRKMIEDDKLREQKRKQAKAVKSKEKSDEPSFFELRAEAEQKRNEARAKLFRAYKAHQELEMEKALKISKPLRLLVKVLERERPNTHAVDFGQIDLDLVDILETLALRQEPEPVRRVALITAQRFLDDVLGRSRRFGGQPSDPMPPLVSDLVLVRQTLQLT